MMVRFATLSSLLLFIPTACARDFFRVLPTENNRGVEEPVSQKLRGGSSTPPATTQAAEDVSKDGFDFVIAGFPKCGTTTLLKAFESHAEVSMSPREQCAIASPAMADFKVHQMLDQTFTELQGDNKRSFKCPTTMYNYKSFSRLDGHSPNSKLVVGMRHPVMMLQSFYNYRVNEIVERQLDEQIPTLEEVLAGPMPWKGVSLASTQFDIFLQQLGKTAMSMDQLMTLMDHPYDVAVMPTTFRVFLYTTDQLEDENETRSAAFRGSMQSFLGLEAPIAPFGRENRVGSTSHSQTVSICDEKWTSVRKVLVERGSHSAKWIREHFLQSADVSVANKDHFLESIETWGTDPCVLQAE